MSALMIAHFGIEEITLSEPDLTNLASSAKDALDELPYSLRALAVVHRPAHSSSNILSIGVWNAGPSDPPPILLPPLAELKQSVDIAAPLECSFRFSSTAIQDLASASWAKQDRTSGHVHMSSNLEVKCLDPVAGEPTGSLATTASGYYELTALPDIGFKLHLREGLTANHGLRKHLDSNVLSQHADTTAQINIGLIVAQLIPVLGALIIWKGNDFANKVAPSADPSAGVGYSLAQQWPVELMVPVDKSGNGKLIISWVHLFLDHTGLRTTGVFFQAKRSPQITLDGPEGRTLKIPSSVRTLKYTYSSQDLRSPIRAQWWINDKPAGTGETQDVQFGGGQDPITITRKIRVTLHDADNLSVTAERTVTFRWILPDGHKPH